MFLLLLIYRYVYDNAGKPLRKQNISVDKIALSFTETKNNFMRQSSFCLRLEDMMLCIVSFLSAKRVASS